MKRAVPIVVALFAACSAPPSQPDWLWEDLPAPTVSDGTASSPSGNQAKSLPAKTWEEDSREPGSPEGPAAEPPSEDLGGKLVINEIYYDAVGSDTDGVVFVELYGEPDLPIGGVRLAFIDGGDGSVDDAIVLPEEARTGSDGFYVVADARTGAASETDVAEADLIDNFDPQNGPDAVQLLDRGEALLDAVGYGAVAAAAAENGLATFEGTPAMDILNGRSLERKEPGRDTDDNAADFTESEAPTPGR